MQKRRLIVRFKIAVEIYRCALLTMIAILLALVVLKMPEPPLTLERARAAKMRPREWQSKIPVVYVGAGNLDVENTVNVQVEGTVDVEGTVSIDR